MRAAIGERIGAILSATSEEVQLIGYGVYEGDEVPPETIGGFNMGNPNPKMVLDDGTVVWGCECWWGPEDEMKKKFKDHSVVHVDMAARRAEAEGGSQ